MYIRSSQIHFLYTDVTVTKLHISEPDFLDCTDLHRLDFLGIRNIILGFTFWKNILKNTALIQTVQTVS